VTAHHQTTVLVDARNVQRSIWPNVPDRRVAELSCEWAAERDVHTIVIFDGRTPGGRVGEEEAGPHCTLVGTGGEIADDWIAREAAALAERGERYWLVTSDRELRRRAGGAAERTIGGGAFVRELLGRA
jgi:hypothetical protein